MGAVARYFADVYYGVLPNMNMYSPTVYLFQRDRRYSNFPALALNPKARVWGKT